MIKNQIIWNFQKGNKWKDVKRWFCKLFEMGKDIIQEGIIKWNYCKKIKKLYKNFKEDEKGWVYALISTNSNEWYIGETSKTLMERFENHYYNGKRVWKRKDKERRELIHKAMWRNGIENWIMIPLFKQEIESLRKDMEKELILKLKPNLNGYNIYKKKEQKRMRKRPNPKYRKIKKKEIKKGESKEEGILLTNWNYNGIDTWNLEDILKLNYKGMISWKKGKMELTNYDNIIKKYKIEILQNNEIRDELDLKSIIKDKEQGSVRIINIKKKEKEILEKWNLFFKNKEKSNYNERELCWFWRKREFLSSKQKAKATRTLNDLMEEKYGYRFPKECIIRVRFREEMNYNYLREDILNWIDKSYGPLYWKIILKKSIKITKIKNRSIEDWLVNVRNFAKEDIFKINTCTCNKVKNRENNEHEVCKLEDLEKEIVGISAKTILKPDSYSIEKDLNSQIEEIKINWKNKLSFKKFYYGKKDLLGKEDVLKNSIRILKTKLKGYVISNRDKNTGGLAVMCPIFFKNKMMETYDWTKWRANYQHVIISVEEVLNIWKRHVKSMEFDTRWNKKGTLPYAYGIPKEKDLNKFRPIVSYANHPLKRLLNTTGRIINFMMKKCNLEGMTLWKTNDVTEKLLEFNEKIQEVWNNEMETIMIVSDIKDMYTNLSHDKIIESIEWLCEIYKYKFGDQISIKPGGRNGGVNGKKKNLWNFDLKMIIEVVKFDLENAAFTFGNIVLRQMIGIPMGSPLSPSIAILTCAKDECISMNSLGSDERYIHGMRYMDDLWLIVLFPKRNDRIRIELSRKILANYQKSLKIEIEQRGETVKFLDKKIIWKNDLLIQQHLGKNWNAISDNGIRKFLNVVDYNSYLEKDQKRGIIIGSLSRVNMNTTINKDKLICGFLTLWEFKKLKYPTRVIRAGCRRMFEKTQSEVWIKLEDIFLRWVNTSCSLPWEY